MRRLSDEAIRLIQTIQTKSTFFSMFSDEQRRVDALLSLGAMRELAAVSFLAGCLDFKNTRIMDAALKALSQIMRDRTIEEYIELDRLRPEGSYWDPPLGACEVRAVVESDSGVLGALTVNRSGYVREAAVRAFARKEDGTELVFLLLRLTDWVEQVRNAAAEAVRCRLTPAYAHHFIPCLPLMVRMTHQKRHGLVNLFELIAELLCGMSCRPQLTSALAFDTLKIRRAALAMVMASGMPDQAVVLKAQLSSVDPVIRLYCFKKLRGILKGQELLEQAQRLQSDTSMGVRREALYTLAEQFPEEAEPALRRALLDKHVSIREAAAFNLTRRGVKSIDHFYRGNLADGGSPLDVLIAGLGECGTKGDAGMLVPYLSHNKSRVRRAAVRAIGKLDVPSFVPNIAEMLLDPISSVARAAAETLMRPDIPLGTDLVADLLCRVKSPHTLKWVVRLVMRFNWWEAARIHLDAAARGNLTVRECALEQLRHWRLVADRLFPRPTARQIQAMEHSFSQASPVLDDATRKDVAMTIDFARSSHKLI